MGKTGSRSIALMVATLFLARAGAAGTHTVPDDFPTVQAALDALVGAPAADEYIYIRPGLPPERPDTFGISAYVHLIGLTSPEDELPTLAGLSVHECTTEVSTLHVTGPVRIYQGYCQDKLFQDCVLDSSLLFLDREIATVRLQGCEIHGSIDAQSDLRIATCTIQGSVNVNACTDGGLEIDFSQVTGPGSHSAGLTGCSRLTVNGCTIRDFSVGIGGGSDGDAAILHSNTIESCDKAVELLAHFSYLEAWGNVIRNCGSGLSNFYEETRVDVRDNSILGCHDGDGIMLQCGAGTVQNNVVGRCASAGIRLSYQGPEQLQVGWNTSYSNASSGYEISIGDVAGQVLFRNNIAFGNQGFGLVATGTPPPVCTCDAWFANSGGAVSGVNPSPVDLFVDPEFCDLPNDDVHLASSSALLSDPNCGLIGALGQGCAAPTGVPENQVSNFELGPMANPARAQAPVSFQLPREVWIEILLLDVQGRTVATLAQGTWPAGRHSVAWPRTVGAGVYFLRYRFPGGESTRRVVRLS